MPQLLTRTEKEDLVNELAQMMDEHQVVGVLDMHSLPARQLQEIKKELVGEAQIKMTRKNLIHLALEQSNRDNITDLTDNTAIQPALIFSEQNPFKLYRTIQEKKTSAPASGGEIAPNDIVLDEGGTGLDPGPMLGRIQELGAQTAVEDGEIAITQSSVAVEEGEVISRNTAEILNTLGMEPLEVGLDLKLVYEDGEIFDKKVLAIDTDAYRDDLASAASGAFNLAVNAGFITEQTVIPMLQNQTSKAHNLAINAGIVNEDTVDTLISQGAGHAAALDAAVDLDSVDISEASPDASEDDNDADQEDAAEDSENSESTGDGEDETAEDEDESVEAEADTDTDDGSNNGNDTTNQTSDDEEEEQ